MSESIAPNTVLQPPGWPRPQGFAYGMRARGDMVFVGGMIGQDENGRFAEGFVAQTKQALANIAAVLAQAGGSPRHIVRLTWYVRDMDEYLGELAALGAAYREIMGRHFPPVPTCIWSSLPGLTPQVGFTRLAALECCGTRAARVPSAIHLLSQ